MREEIEDGRPARSRWRFVPLGSAAFVYLAAGATFGFGFVLGPLTLLPTLIAYRRTESPRGWVFWLGAAATAVLAVTGAYILAAIAYEDVF